MAALKRLFQKDIEAVTKNLSDIQREIDSNVVIAHEFISYRWVPKALLSFIPDMHHHESYMLRNPQS